MGSTANAAGVIQPDFPWLNRAIVVAILAGYASVILVMLMGQSRVFYSMSKDGLIPKIFSVVNPKTQTPSKSNLLFMVFVSAFAAFVPATGCWRNDEYRNFVCIYIGVYRYLGDA